MIKFQIIMGVEQKSQTKQTLFESLKHGVPEFLFQHGTPLVQYYVERVLEAGPVIYPEGFSHAIKEAALENYFFIFYGNHTSHFDPVAQSRVTRDVTLTINKVLPKDRQSKGVLMPIAISVGSGHQDKLLTLMYKSVWPKLVRGFITPVDMSRVKDNSQFGIPLNRREFTREMLHRIREGHKGIILYPEGTVEGGRKKPDGKPKGMQPFVEGSIATFTSFGEHATGKVLYIPMGIEGSFNVFAGDKRPPLFFVAGGLLLPHPALTITRVGMPIKSDGNELRGLTNGERDTFLAKRITELIPTYLHGVYASGPSQA